MTNIHTLLVPGLDGSAAPHWQDWWAITEPGASLVDLPEACEPNPLLWEGELLRQVRRHPGAVLVGHSLGSVLIARLLARRPGLPVAGALLVAPADPDRSNRTSGFAPLPDTRLPVPSLLVASRNDPWMSHARSAKLAAVWGSDFVDLGYFGHINAASGFGPWAGGKMLRDDLVGRPGLLHPAIQTNQLEARHAVR